MKRRHYVEDPVEQVMIYEEDKSSNPITDLDRP